MSKCVFLILVLLTIHEKIAAGMINGANISMETSTWMVMSEDTGEVCITASGDITVRLVVNDNITVTVEEIPIPADVVSVEGVCGDQESEMKLVWSDLVTGEENMLNLVVTRKGRLAGLTGAFLRLQVGDKSDSQSHDSIEMMTRMDFRHVITPVWPLRYGLNCPLSLEFPLYPAPIHILLGDVTEYRLDQPTGVLVLDNLRLEAFRDENLVENHDSNLKSDLLYFNRRTWECEFHVTLDWAPIVVGCGLAGLVIFVVSSFFCKRSLEKKRNKYDLM